MKDISLEPIGLEAAIYRDGKILIKYTVLDYQAGIVLKVSRALGIGILIFQVLTLIILVLALHTIGSVLSSALSGDTIKLNININQSTGDKMLTLNAKPSNGGYLGANVYIDLSVLDDDGVIIARNSTSVYIGPGGKASLVLSLVVTKDDALRYNLTQGGGFVEITFRIRTLADFVGFQNTMKMKSE